jgi:predicted acetyltransferase
MSSPWKPRAVDREELRSVLDLASVAFGEGPSAPEARWDEYRLFTEADRTFVVEDEGHMVGTGGAFSFEVALPGGAGLPMCGVTWVAVLPTHTRRGILTTVMRTLLDQALERGEALAGLTASEGVIYRRFGFGVGARSKDLTLDTTRAAELVDVDVPGRFRLVGWDEAMTVLPEVWERHWRRSAAEIRRTSGWWKSLRIDPEMDRDGASALYVVVHEDATGRPDGFATYRHAEGGAMDDEYDELRVDSIAAADDQVERAILRYLVDVDLIRKLTWHNGPSDLPLRWSLVDPRALSVSRERDFVWARPLDVATCLASRGYVAGPDGAVIEVVDPSRPELGGTFRLDAGADGAECARSDAEPDVVLSQPELGSLLYGDVTWSTLRRAGLVDERTPGTVDRLDTLFRVARAPHCATDF